MDRLRRGNSRAELAPAHAHLVGLADRGMTGLAQMLVQRGVRVTGTTEPTSSPALARLRALGVRVHDGHTRRCPREAEVLLYGPGVGRDHPERLSAARRGLAQQSPAQWLGHWMREKIGLAVAGQREASVASAMIGWTLARAGLDPTVVLGAPLPQLGGWARHGSGPHFVVEAVDEAGDVGPASPRVAVILNVVAPRGLDPSARVAALRRFAASVPSDGCVLALEQNALVAEAVRGIASAVEGISLERGSAWWGADLREEGGRYRFRAFHRGRFAVEVRLRVPGRRNVLCALAAVAACERLDIPAPAIKQGLEEFAGLSRDFESRGSYRGVTLLDDEGRDPAAVSEALAIGRQVFGSRRLWAVFHADGGDWQPGDQDRFRAAFVVADHVLVIEPGRCFVEGGAGGEGLVGDLVAAGGRARRVATLDEAIADLDQHLEPGDVLVTLGAGDVGTIADAFIRRLSRDRQGR